MIRFMALMLTSKSLREKLAQSPDVGGFAVTTGGSFLVSVTGLSLINSEKWRKRASIASIALGGTALVLNLGGRKSLDHINYVDLMAVGLVAGGAVKLSGLG